MTLKVIRMRPRDLLLTIAAHLQQRPVELDAQAAAAAEALGACLAMP